ncbi:MAG TPA: UTP--glucose-1-phosphate uridylyltransferase GalU [Acidimicrobiales bacterium]|nr:UTP--glucose-1-phosphate uridylyltransferase GalU [Acidimicrobiales bacterium]
MPTSVRKAVIPAAGLGTRFLPASKAQPKEMVPVVDKPAIQYVVEEAVRASLTDILVITGRGKRSLEDHFDRTPELEWELERKGKHAELKQMQAIAEMAVMHFVRQAQAKGLGHAVGMARQHIGEESFAVMLGDDVMDEKSRVLEEMIAVHGRHGSSVVALKKVDPSEISSYGCVRAEPAGEDNLVVIKEIVEKPAPENAPSNLAVMGRYVFNAGLFQALDGVRPGSGGEIQLTDAIGLLTEDETVHGYVFEKGRYDIGNKLGYLIATVELALEREDVGPEFRAFLAELARREGLV